MDNTKYKFSIWLNPICLFWFLYSITSTILNNYSTPSWTFYPIYLLIILSAAYNLNNNKSDEEHFKYNIYVYLLFIFVVIASILYSNYDGNLPKKLFIYSLPLLVYLNINSKKSFYDLVNVQIIVSIILCIWVVYENYITGGYKYRGGIDVNQNYISMIISIGLIGIVHKILTTQLNSPSLSYKFLYITSICTCIYSLMVLGSRGSIIAVVLAILTLTIIFRKNYTYLLVFLISLSLYIFSVHIFLPGGNNLFERIFSDNVYTLSGRADLWEQVLRRFYIDTPFFQQLFGVGFGDSRDIVNGIYSNLHSMHNLYLQFLVEFGIFGIMSFLLLIIFTFLSVSRSENSFKIYVLPLLIFSLIFPLASSPDGFLYWVVWGQLLRSGGFKNVTEGINNNNNI